MVSKQKGLVKILLTLWIVNMTAIEIKPSVPNKSISENVLSFLEKLWNEKPFETLVVYLDQNSSLVDQVLTEIKRPVVLFSQVTTYEYREKFNSEILLVRFFSKHKDNELFLEFQPFPVQTNFRVLYIFEEKSQAVDIFEQYCSSTQEFQIINMLAIIMDFGATKTYLRCRQLDSPDVELKQYSESSILYEDRLRDLGGKEILTLEDLLEPRTMNDIDKNGKRIIGGYVGKYLNAFVKKHNAKLKSIYEVEANRTIFYGVIQNITREGRLDIGATLIVHLHASNFDELTYPFELSTYCFMVPISPDLPLSQTFMHIVSPSVCVILIALIFIFGILFSLIQYGGRLSLQNVFLNDRSIRGMLGQSFPQPRNSTKHFRFVLMLICFTSIIVNTMYDAYLQSFLTQPPKEPPLITVQEILGAGKRVIAAREEMFIFKDGPGFSMKRHAYIFAKILGFHEFTRHRASLDTNYVYPVSRTRWIVFSEQQRLFARELFFYNKKRCMLPFMLLCLPIPKNSRYRHAFERVMLQIQDSGLLMQWMSWNFYDMVRLNRTSLKDISNPKEYGIALKLGDFYWIWCLYLGGIILSLLLFCWELFWWRWV